MASKHKVDSINYDLILGKNIREWRIGVLNEHDTIVLSASSSDHEQIYIGQSPSGGPAVQDMLKLSIPESYRESKLAFIVFRDVTQFVIIGPSHVAGAGKYTANLSPLI